MSAWHRPDVEAAALEYLTAAVGDPVGARQIVDGLLARGREQRAAEVRALAEQVENLEQRLAELETFAYGCDAEGCVIPHSSWCEVAKRAAAKNDGCTCPQPWEGSPQPHAGYCWIVSPPRDEVEGLRKQLALALARHGAGS